MNLQQAIEYVQNSNDALVQAQLAALLEGAPAPDAVIEAVRQRQNVDGSWPYASESGNPPSLHETCRWLHTLEALDAVGTDSAERARSWLRDQQHPRGWWRESDDLARLDPPLWMHPESDDGTIYTTALCANTLALLGEAEDTLAIDQAVTWLQPQIANNGLLPGFRVHATALALPAFVAIAHAETRSVKRMLRGLGDVLSDAWDTSMLALALIAVAQAGLDRHIKLVERLLNLLTQRQQPDGAWRNDDDQPDAVLTLQILRAARRVGIR